MKRLLASLFAMSLLTPMLPVRAEIRPGALQSVPQLYYTFISGEERKVDGWSWYNLFAWHNGTMPFNMRVLLVTMVGYTAPGRHTLAHQFLDPNRTTVLREVAPYAFDLKDQSATFVVRNTISAEIQQPGKYWFRVIYDGKAIEDVPYLILRD